MTNFAQLADSRYSQRAYDTQRPVPRELLLEILETVRLAPSAANKQPWEILVLQSPDALNRIHSAYTRDWFLAAPCVIAIKGRQDQAWVRPFDGYNALETDLAIAMDHLTLAAADHGLGTCWIGNFDPAVLAEALSLGQSERVYAITPLGWAPAGHTKPAQKPRKSMGELVRFL